SGRCRSRRRPRLPRRVPACRRAGGRASAARRARAAAARMSVVEVAQSLRAGEQSPVEAVSHALARIRALDGELNAFISVREEEALREAHAAERATERGALWGVPLAVKDVIDVAGA